MHEGELFYEESDGAIYFDVTAEIEYFEDHLSSWLQGVFLGQHPPRASWPLGENCRSLENYFLIGSCSLNWPGRIFPRLG